MGEHRHVRLFRNGRNQAVRIPVEFELPEDMACCPDFSLVSEIFTFWFSIRLDGRLKY